MNLNLNRSTMLIAGTGALMLAGCQSTGDRVESKRPYNEAMVAHHINSPAERAVIEQQTLYSYHFVPNGSELNTIGENDMAVLTAHYRKYPGSLSIQRGNAGDDLYQQRVDVVRNMLLDAGVEESRMALREGMPGGSGVDSDRGMLINERANEQRSSSGGTNLGQVNTWR